MKGRSWSQRCLRAFYLLRKWRGEVPDEAFELGDGATHVVHNDDVRDELETRVLDNYCRLTPQ